METRISAWRRWRIRRQHERIARTREKLRDLLVSTPRNWRAVQTGGGASIELPNRTLEQCTELLHKAGHNITYVDYDVAFIALGRPDADFSDDD